MDYTKKAIPLFTDTEARQKAETAQEIAETAQETANNAMPKSAFSLSGTTLTITW